MRYCHDKKLQSETPKKGELQIKSDYEKTNERQKRSKTKNYQISQRQTLETQELRRKRLDINKKRKILKRKSESPQTKHERIQK